MTELFEAISQLVPLLERLGASYAVMGGIAVRAYGIPRATYDVDFTLALPRDRLQELYGAVGDIGYTVPEAYQKGWVDQVSGLSLVKFRWYRQGQGIDIDVFLAEAPFQKEVLKRRRRVQLDGLTVWLVSPEDLVLLKLLAARPRDMADIGDVLFTQGQLDEAYLRHWADELGVRAALEQALTHAA
jgi:predicted nucleotidyltransferase